MIAVVRTWFLIALMAAGTAWAQKPIVTEVHVNDSRIVQITGVYVHNLGTYQWNINIVQEKGRYVANVRTTHPDLGEQNTVVPLKQVPPVSGNGADSIRFEGTGTSVEDQYNVRLVVILRSNNSHTLEIHQGVFAGSFSIYPAFVPDAGPAGVDIDSLHVDGTKVFYIANGGGLFSTAFATIKGAKLGACTLKAKGPGFQLSMPGEIVQSGPNLSFVPSTVKASVLKAGKVRFTIDPTDISVSVTDAN